MRVVCFSPLPVRRERVSAGGPYLRLGRTVFGRSDENHKQSFVHTCVFRSFVSRTRFFTGKITRGAHTQSSWCVVCSTEKSEKKKGNNVHARIANLCVRARAPRVQKDLDVVYALYICRCDVNKRTRKRTDESTLELLSLSDAELCESAETV